MTNSDIKAIKAIKAIKTIKTIKTIKLPHSYLSASTGSRLEARTAG